MLVPVVVAASASEAPSSRLVIVTVAEARLALSGSVTVRALSSTTGGPASVKTGALALRVTVGAVLTAATVTFLSALALLAVPSLATKRMTRAVVAGITEVLL